jgi:hypothetical protein
MANSIASAATTRVQDRDFARVPALGFSRGERMFLIFALSIQE